MLIDANIQAQNSDLLKADTVVVGAGTVALFLASMLADDEKSRDIVLLESGGRVPSTQSNGDSAAGIGKAHNGLMLGRASGLGGTSALWGGQLAEFEPADLSRPDAPWQLSYEELKDLYGKVYQKLGMQDLPSDAVCRQRFGREQAVSGDVERFFTHWLETPNFARFFKRAVESEKVRIYLNASVNDIDFEGSSATSVRARTTSGKSITVCARRFIFAAGTIGTNRFFLTTQRLSRVPWAGNDQVGRYFQDHLGGTIATAEILNEKLFREYFENAMLGGHKVQPKLRIAPAVRSGLDSGACAFFGFDSTLRENFSNIKLFAKGLKAGLSFSSGASAAKDFVAIGRSLGPIAIRYAKDRRILALMDRGVKVLAQAEQIPLAGSRITAADGEVGPDGLLRALVDWRCNGREIEAIGRLAGGVDDYLQKRGLAKLSIEDGLAARDPSFIDTLSDTYHQCGGMRMSSHPADGVVDGNCRVWGTENVWVAGASVFPSSSHANCTLTALALAARLAARLN